MGPPLFSFSGVLTLLLDRLQPLLTIDRRHASRAGGGDRLAIELILDVACDEDSGNAGAGAVFRLDVPDLVDLKLALEDVGVRPVSDCDEEPVAREVVAPRP